MAQVLLRGTCWMAVGTPRRSLCQSRPRNQGGCALTRPRSRMALQGQTGLQRSPELCNHMRINALDDHGNAGATNRCRSWDPVYPPNRYYQVHGLPCVVLPLASIVTRAMVLTCAVTSARTVRLPLRRGLNPSSVFRRILKLASGGFFPWYLRKERGCARRDIRTGPGWRTGD